MTKKKIQLAPAKSKSKKSEGSKTEVAEVSEVAEEPAKKPSDDIPPPPRKKGGKTRIDMRQVEAEERRRAAPTRGTDQQAAPYPCPKCRQIAVLVAVKVKDHDASYKQKKDVFKSETRCEKCFNKPPSDLILKWGAAPDESYPIPDQD